MRRCTGRRGTAEALGVVLMTPLMVGLAVIVVVVGRDVDRHAEIASVSAAAATVAAQQRSASRAVDLATSVARRLLVDSPGCGRHRIAVDTSRFGPGGAVVVTIDCEVSSDGLGALVDADGVVSVSSSAAIDPYRSLP